MYKLLRSFLFLFDPEKVHYFSMNALRILCVIPGVRNLIRNNFRPKPDHYSFLNIPFPNRVGLAAGFDKNAKYLDELEALGFGCVEIGTVTPLPQAGNDKPRLFRLPADKALINRMGFNNDGVEVVANRLKGWREKLRVTSDRLRVKELKVASDELRVNSKHHPETNNPKPITRNSLLIIGGNIGKNKVTPNEEAWTDYEKCFTALHDHVDYFVVNVSSPNTPGLRALQEKDSLKKILGNLQELNKKYQRPKPILLKIAPDLTIELVDDVIDLAREIKLEGLVVSNTTIARNELSEHSRIIAEKIGAGGLSGLPIKKRSTELVQYIYQKTNGQIPIIASGGIFTGADAKEKINAGASLVQVYTGFIYEGPAIVKNISTYLAAVKVVNP